MGHKADSKYFDVKRPWSKQKDVILENYLYPYMKKVATLRRPILLVDGFAGRGEFRDGSPGSPLIIAQQAERLINQGVSVQQICIEPDNELFSHLQECTSKYSFITCKHASFLDIVPTLERHAANMTVFLYLDPYTVEGLEWKSLDSILKHLHSSGSSIELLLNFNAHSFARRARAALAINQPVLNKISGDDDTGDAVSMHSVSEEHLNQIVGGFWWKDILQQRLEFSNEVLEITKRFMHQLRMRFRQVYEHQVKAHWEHTIPKYWLIFGSRSPDATILMNDAVVKGLKEWVDAISPPDETFFDIRPCDVVPDIGRLPSIVLSAASEKMNRGKLILKVIQENFGVYSETQSRQAISTLIKQGRITSHSGKTRINDNELVWRTGR